MIKVKVRKDYEELGRLVPWQGIEEEWEEEEEKRKKRRRKRRRFTYFSGWMTSVLG